MKQRPITARPSRSPWRKAAGRLLLGLSCLASVAPAAQASFELVVGAADAPRALRILGGEAQETPLPSSTPLGSLWKLFVYAYLLDQGITSPDYRCTGRDPSEETYCCAPGETIDRDQALAKSCGLYFRPSRLGIDAATWMRYWQSRPAPTWLGDLSRLDPATEVPVVSLLQALGSIDEPTRVQVMRTLLRVTLEPRARPLLTATGSRLRIKTWSWHDARGRRIGGFAGWLADGTPVWLRGMGTSASVIEAIAPWIATHLPESGAADEACVNVRFFNRYPLAEVLLDGRTTKMGPLRGQVEVRFSNGQQVRFANSGDMRLVDEAGSRRIEGRFGMNDYVARVIQREAAGEPAEAARALGVAVRTYLVRHADFAAGCYRMSDDSRTQRVSPHSPNRQSRAAAEWSDGLILNGADGRYHLTLAKPRQLSWRQAMAAAAAGQRWDQILADAYGAGGFGLIGDGDAGECQPLTQAETWLAAREIVWTRRLKSIPGFESPSPRPRICRLQHGNPYADLGRSRIYAYGIASENDRLAIAHEYLHFGLASHPRGRDEDYVERTARQLLGSP